MDKWLLAIAEFFVLTALTILAERFLSTKTAFVVLAVGTGIVLFVHRGKLKEFQQWAVANKGAAVLTCTLAGTLIGLGCGLLVTFKAEAQQSMTKPEEENKTPDSKPADKRESKPGSPPTTQEGKAKPPASKTGDSISVGSISQGPGSIAQIGGSGNTAIINGPLARSMDKKAQFNLIAALKNLVPANGEPPMVAIRIAETTKEPQEYSGQIAYAFQQAGWVLRYYPNTESRLNVNGRALSSGVYCQGQRSNETVKAAVDALQDAGINCQVIDLPARDDVTIVTLRIMVGKNE